jgi:hypothetical protein
LGYILEAEHAENEFRESLTLTEKAALAAELRAQMPKHQGARTDSTCVQAEHKLPRGKTEDHIWGMTAIDSHFPSVPLAG